MSDRILNKVVGFLAGEAGEDDIREVLSWREQHPKEFERIKLIYEGTPFVEMEFNADERKQQILERIGALSKRKQVVRNRHLSYWLKIAAVFAGLMAIGFSLYFYNNSLAFQKTNLSHGLIEIDLPDGSTVTLDANSTLSYKKTWLNQFNREVDLKGRAYFKVEKINAKNFIVNTSESRTEVMGTQFSVSDYFGKTQIVLNEGIIKITSVKVNKTFLLSKQGEQLIISENGIVKQGLINKNLYFSWLRNKLNFDNCKVSETLDFLADSYNLSLVMDDPDALNMHLFGSAPSDNPDLILEAIARLTDKKIEKVEKTITFE
jgi:ferric-dicitrate binding protein FerR (iron transport regulator)